MKRYFKVVCAFTISLLSLPVFAADNFAQVTKFLNHLMGVVVHQESLDAKVKPCFKSMLDKSNLSGWVMSGIVSKSSPQELQDLQNFEVYLSEHAGQEVQSEFEQILNQSNGRTQVEINQSAQGLVQKVIESARPEQLRGLNKLMSEPSELFRQKGLEKIMLENDVCRAFIIEKMS